MQQSIYTHKNLFPQYQISAVSPISHPQFQKFFSAWVSVYAFLPIIIEKPVRICCFVAQADSYFRQITSRKFCQLVLLLSPLSLNSSKAHLYTAKIIWHVLFIFRPSRELERMENQFSWRAENKSKPRGSTTSTSSTLLPLIGYRSTEAYLTFENKLALPNTTRTCLMPALW